MMEEYKEKLERLKICAKMETEEDVQNFDLLVSELIVIKDKYILSGLIDLFNDDCEFEGVMYSLIHAIETYPNDIYIETLLLKLYCLEKFPDWYSTLIYRVMNHEESYNILKSQIKTCDPKSLEKLLNYIEQDSDIPRHKEQVEELRKLIKIR